MKINSISNSNHLKRRAIEHSCEKRKSSAYININNKDYNDQINTTITRNSDGRVSFGSSATPLLHKVATFTANNPLVAEAIFAIFITCGLRPITIMATAKDEKDKEKCSYQAVKSISSGVVGLAMTSLVGTPIAAAAKKAQEAKAFSIPPEVKEKASESVKKGVDVLKELGTTIAEKGGDTALGEKISSVVTGDSLNLGALKESSKKGEKIFLDKVKTHVPEDSFNAVVDAIKNQKTLNNYSKAGKNVIDKLLQPVFMPLRAAVTIALVPVILGLLGKKKPDAGKKQEQKQEQTPQKTLPAMPLNSFQNNKEKELFGSFSQGGTNASK